MADDDDLDAIDAVHADDLGVCQHRQLTVTDVHGFLKASAKALSCTGVMSTKHHEKASTTPQSLGGCSDCAVAAASDDEIDGSAHCVGPTGARPSTRIGPLSVRRNASS